MVGRLQGADIGPAWLQHVKAFQLGAVLICMPGTRQESCPAALVISQQSHMHCDWNQWYELRRHLDFATVPESESRPRSGLSDPMEPWCA